MIDGYLQNIEVLQEIRMCLIGWFDGCGYARVDYPRMLMWINKERKNMPEFHRKMIKRDILDAIKRKDLSASNKVMMKFIGANL